IFDAVMNYRFADAMLKYFADNQNAFDAKQLNAQLQQVRNDYPTDVNYVLMNLMDSHDTERLASMVVNPNRMIDHASSASSKEHNFDVRKPNAEEIKTQKLIIAFQMLYLGAPMIYYGGEAGMWGADDPDERKPMVWPDMIYEPEKSHPLGKPRPEDPVAFDQDLFDYHKTFTNIRRENNAIRRGDYQYVEVSQSPEVFAFTRSDGTQSNLCVFNRSAAAQEITLPVSFAENKFLFGEKNLLPSSKGKFSITSKSVAVLLKL
ncbi:MAG: alpha-amylase family glycosyl hydrolase, partial [bacterium]